MQVALTAAAVVLIVLGALSLRLVWQPQRPAAVYTSMIATAEE